MRTASGTSAPHRPAGGRRNVAVLRPQQQKSRLTIRRATDFRSQRMIKCPEICHFHSLAEFYHAALLEGDVAVECYVPQPFRLRFARTTYIPDIYYVRDGRATVGELKPRGEMDESLRQAASDYFAGFETPFEVIANEAIYAQAMQAQNWLSVVRWLLTYPTLDTERARLQVLQWLLEDGELIRAGHNLTILPVQD